MANAAPITLDGDLDDWTQGDRIDRGLDAGYAIHARSDGDSDSFAFALTAPGGIGANTTAWLNTDRNGKTGYQIFGSAGGAAGGCRRAARPHRRRAERRPRPGGRRGRLCARPARPAGGRGGEDPEYAADATVSLPT